MEDYEYESKQLVLQIKENEAKYLSGELSLDEPLDQTDKLYDSALAAAKKSSAGKVLHDSGLMQLQSKIIRQRAKSYKPDTLVFDPRSFSEKLKRHCTGVTTKEDTSRKALNEICSTVWQKLGEESQKKMHITPSFSFMYGTFKPEPASPVKKQRKKVEKDKIAPAVKPKTGNLSESNEGKDPTFESAQRVLTLLMKYVQKSEKGSVCFYEFVTDPFSFTRTIENIFTVSLLVQIGSATIFPDDQGLPCLRYVDDNEKKTIMHSKNRMQSVLSMSIEEWQAIKEKGNFKTAMIPRSKSQQNATQN